MTPDGWKPHQVPIALDKPGIQQVTAASAVLCIVLLCTLQAYF